MHAYCVDERCLTNGHHSDNGGLHVAYQVYSSNEYKEMINLLLLLENCSLLEQQQ